MSVNEKKPSSGRAVEHFGCRHGSSLDFVAGVGHWVYHPESRAPESDRCARLAGCENFG